MGCVIAGQEPSSLNQFAQTLGVMYQVVDDILDTHSDPKDKPTVVSLLGQEKAQQLAKDLHQAAQEELKKVSINSEQLQQLTDNVHQRIL